MILVLMAVSIITVGSTIRLSVFARRREIEIMKYVGATNHLVTLPFFVEGLTMGLISGAITSVAGIFGYAYIVQASSTLGGLWQLLMGTAMVPVDAVWPTILTYSLAGGALVGALGSMVLHPQASECVSERSLLCETSKTLCGFRLHFMYTPTHAKPAPGHSRAMRAASLFLAAACLLLSVSVYPATAATSMSSRRTSWISSPSPLYSTKRNCPMQKRRSRPPRRWNRS
mgnify:CR=1 FL=1